MNIINLTTESTKYNLVQESIEKMDSALMGCNDAPWIQLSSYQAITSESGSFGSFAYRYANKVPVFFVTVGMAGKSVDVTFQGRNMKVMVPNDSKPSTRLEGDVNTILGNTQKTSIKSAATPIKLEARAIMGVSTHIDTWGMYVSSCKPLQKGVNTQPMIFIWVDKIYDYVQKNHQGNSAYYNLYTCQTILLEMMHALMDINVLTSTLPSNTGSIPEWFNVLREGSVATAASLTMMDGEWNPNDMNYLAKCLSDASMPFQYRLGPCYYKAGKDAVDHAIENWIGRKYNKKLAEDLLRYAKTSFPKTSAEQLALYDEGFTGRQVSVFKYQSNLSRPDDMILYSKEALVIKVIRDYSEMHPTSKSGLIAAFPSNLNEDFEVFIDPQVTDHFTDKHDPSNTRPVYDNHDVKCTDGKLIICDYWHINSMHPFVEHARSLGINIIDFWS